MHVYIGPARGLAKSTVGLAQIVAPMAQNGSIFFVFDEMTDRRVAREQPRAGGNRVHHWRKPT